MESASSRMMILKGGHDLPLQIKPNKTTVRGKVFIPSLRAFHIHKAVKGGADQKRNVSR